MTTEPTQPLTEDQTARMRASLVDAIDRDGELYLTTDAPHDMRALLDEVDRLRAENTAQANRIAAVGSLARNWANASHEAKAGVDRVLQESYGTTAIAECGRALLRALGLDQDGAGNG